MDPMQNTVTDTLLAGVWDMYKKLSLTESVLLSKYLIKSSNKYD